jgi:hypothetical protein
MEEAEEFFPVAHVASVNDKLLPGVLDEWLDRTKLALEGPYLGE